jgi:phosphotransferase system  glucose/maltose/N-acetylglucosamine-specific IIC component
MNFFERNKLTIFTMAVLLGLLAWAIWIMVQMWTSIEGDMGTHQIVAMWLGIIFSCLVGFGLMGLIFYSSRKGYDETPTFTVDGDSDDDDTNPHG